MRPLTIKAQLVLALLLTLGIGGAVIVSALRRTFAADASQVVEQSVTQAAATFRTLSDGEVTTLSAALEALAVNRAIVAAWAAGDRGALQQETTAVYGVFKARDGITNWSFTGADGTTFFRLSDPSYFGEKVDRPTVVRCLETRAPQTGFAVGSQGFALRVSRAVFDGERFLGCMEVGAEINRFVALMKAQTGHEYMLVLAKAGIDPEKWARGRALIGLPNNWNEAPSLVVAADTSAKGQAPEADVSLESLGDGGRVLGTTELGERTLARGAFSVADASGRRAAGIFVTTDISRLSQSLQRSEQVAVGVVLSLMLLISLVLLVLFDRLVFRRLDGILRVATRVVGGDFETAVPVSRDDEIGRFEALFEQFRQVFISVLDEAKARGEAQTPPERAREAR